MVVRPVRRRERVRPAAWSSRLTASSRRDFRITSYNVCYTKLLRYGRHRAALAATVISYRSRSAVREVCKALGLSEDISSALANGVWGSWT